MNLYRTEPQTAVADLKLLKSYFVPGDKPDQDPSQKYLRVPGEYDEGDYPVSYDNVISYFEKLQPMKALRWDERLCEAAKFHTEDVGPKGLMQDSSSDGTKFGDRIKRYTSGYQSTT